MSSNLLSRITMEPAKLGGKPCIRGMRIGVDDVFEYLASGMSVEEVLADFPYLEKDDTGLLRVRGSEGAQRGPH